MKKLDTKHFQIKDQVETAYEFIRQNEVILERLRAECEHPATELVNYQFRVGQIIPNVRVCSVCGSLVGNNHF